MADRKPAEWEPEDFLNKLPERATVTLESRLVHLCTCRYDLNGATGGWVPVYLLAPISLRIPGGMLRQRAEHGLASLEPQPLRQWGRQKTRRALVPHVRRLRDRPNYQWRPCADLSPCGRTMSRSPRGTVALSSAEIRPVRWGGLS